MFIMVEDYQENYITGWVKLYRSFINWEWFTVPNMVHVFIYCLLKANHKDNRWRGIEIKRGCFITSYATMSNETNLSIKKIRLALSKLEKSGEIIRKSGNQNTLITICKYDTYQSFNDNEGKQKANGGQTEGNQRATNNNDNNIKNEKNTLYDEQLFLKDWNKLRFEILKKPSHVKRLSNYESREQFKEISNAYTQEEIHNAMLGLFKQQIMPKGIDTLRTTPVHFLKEFERYLQAYNDKNKYLYGDKKE